MRHVSELIPHLKSDHSWPRRTIGRRGNDDLLHERAQAPDRLMFDARRLVENGWSAADEINFQTASHQCSTAGLVEGYELVEALRIAEAEQKITGTKRDEARGIVHNIVAASMPPEREPGSDDDRGE